MSGRRAGDSSLHDRRERIDLAQVLVIRLSTLPYADKVHDRQLPPHHAVGARARAREDADAAGCQAASRGYATTDGGACLRHAQIVAWNHAIADEDPSKGQNGGQLGGTGLQDEADDQDHGRAGHGEGHCCLSIMIFAVALTIRTGCIIAGSPALASFYTASAVCSRQPSGAG